MRKIANSVLLLMLIVFSSTLKAENFPKPVELRPDIDFWKRVYTEVDTSTGFIHDSRNLAIVYETVAKSSSGNVSRNTTNRRKAHYKKILSKLASGRRSGLTKEEKRVLALWGEGVSNKRLKQAAGDIRFQRGQADRFREGIIRSGEWRDYIDQVMLDMNMPLELSILPHVESSFNPEAYSKVGAAGMWQFIRSTGKRYLHIDHVIDERMDPFAATIAAAKLLKHNHSITDSWPLALTAYNHGLASMRRAINSLGTTNIAVIARQYKGRAFGFASRNFYVAFVAALEVDQDPEKYFGRLNLAKPYDYELVTLQHYIPASAVSQKLNISETVLQRHNRSLLASVWNGAKRIPKGYTLRIPKQSLSQSANRLVASIPATQKYSKQTQDTFHVVTRGDTISGIAKRYGFRVSDIMASNGISNRHLIRIGQKLRLPVKQGDQVVVAKVDEKKKAPPAPAAPKKSLPESPSKPAITAKQEDKQVIAKEDSPSQVDAIHEPAIDDVVLEKQPIKNEEIETVAETTLVTDAQATLLSDPNDYTVANDQTIEVQASETLGHYAEWLDLRASQLRKINKMRFGKPVVVGKRLRLDFSRVEQNEFEKRRVAYQRDLQEEFFTQFRIESTYQYHLKRGDSLWVLAMQKFKIPLWLLRQHNPDTNFDRITPGDVIVIPKLVEAKNVTTEPAA